MKNKGLLRYFQNWIPLIIAGLGVAGVGALIREYAREIRVIATPIMSVGAILVLAGFLLRVSDNNYFAYFTNKVEVEKNKVTYENAPDYTSAVFSFDDNKFSRIGGNQKPISEIYVHTDLYFDKNELYVERFTVDVSNDSIVKDKYTFPLSEIYASVEEKELRVKGVLKKAVTMTLKAGELSTKFPVRYNDIGVDQLVERINQTREKLQA